MVAYLKKVHDFEISPTHFGRLVKSGIIPVAWVEGSTNRFAYTPVVEALTKAGRMVKTIKVNDINTNVENTEETIKDKEAYLRIIKEELSKSPDLTTAKIYQTIYAGKKVELEVLKERGTLVPIKEVEAKAFAIARIVRDKMLAIPTRVSPMITDMTDTREIEELLFKEVGEALEEISKETPFQ